MSDAVVRAMAEGALERTGANVAIAVSGIAGPERRACRASPWARCGSRWRTGSEDRLECQGHLIQFDGNRDAVRRQAVEYALNLLRALPQPRREHAAAVFRAAARRRNRTPRCWRRSRR